MAHSKESQFESPYDFNHVVSHYGGALSYPARVLIMRWLADGPRKAGEISEHISLAKSTTSHHLANLERAGLIGGQEQGPHITYEFNWEGYRAMRHFVLELFAELDAKAPKEEVAI